MIGLSVRSVEAAQFIDLTEPLNERSGLFLDLSKRLASNFQNKRLGRCCAFTGCGDDRGNARHACEECHLTKALTGPNLIYFVLETRFLIMHENIEGTADQDQKAVPAPLVLTQHYFTNLVSAQAHHGA